MCVCGGGGGGVLLPGRGARGCGGGFLILYIRAYELKMAKGHHITQI